ncbi:MAG: sugar ABC transporter ATP-binding protein [Eubacteriales bacterium]|nr:sugar ABC transporter ATP-binding protein [Eubacteriales bacterium]
MPEALLCMRNIEKQFPGVKALTNANIELHSGEVLGLMGENGAGKSTLMNILGGIHKPDNGQILIDGREVSINNVIDAQSNGIAFIHQELAMEQHLTVAENIFLGREITNRFHLVSKSEMNRQAGKYLDIVGLNISPDTKVGRLSTGQQQMLEIAKAFSLNSRIIVMDEPTSSLSEKEVEILFRTVRDLKKRNMGIIYISHKMQEIFDLTDRVVVMRDGQYINTKVTAETTPDELVRMMVGRDLESYYVRTFNTPGEVALEARDVSSGARVKHCSFSARKGEILGFYGLVGAGRSELMQTLLGLDPITSGSVTVNGKTFERPTPVKMQRQKLALVPESRKTEGLFLNNTIKFNTTIAVLGRFIKRLRVNYKKENDLSEQAIHDFSIKCSSSMQRIVNLSGGNQQKVVLAKWLLAKPQVLIMDEPTRGVDVGAKAEIYAIMNQLVANGNAIIMVSSELNEVINMCDRLVIMSDGRIVTELDRPDFDQNTILHYALGGETR